MQCRYFELYTDCSALKRISGPKNDYGGCASSRLNRWAAALSGFDFTVFHIKGTSNSVMYPLFYTYDCSYVIYNTTLILINVSIGMIVYV